MMDNRKLENREPAVFCRNGKNYFKSCNKNAFTCVYSMKAATGKLQKGERHEEFESRKNQRFANSGSIGIGDDSNDERYGIRGIGDKGRSSRHRSQKRGAHFVAGKTHRN